MDTWALIIQLLIYIGKVIYFMLPGVFANMAPIIVRGQFRELAVPVDRNMKLVDKHSIFGKSKTYRGIIFGVLFSIIIATLQKIIYKEGILTNIVIINYNDINIFVFGLAIGLGVLLGDLVKSFFKRRIGIPPSKPFVPWDQIDSAIGAVIAYSFMFGFDWVLIVTVIVLSYGLHRLIRIIAYSLKITKEMF